MKVLFVCPFVPWPLVNGGKIRSYHLIKSVAQHAQVHLRILHEPNEQPGAAEALAPNCASLKFFDRTQPGPVDRLRLPKLERWFHSAALQADVARDIATGGFQLVHLDELLLARIVPRPSSVPVVQHHHKLDTVLYDTLAEGGRTRRHFDLWKLRRLERESARRYRHHLLCSQGDAEILRSRYGSLDVGVVPSGFDPADFATSSPPVLRVRDRLLFLGSMNYGPNVGGIEWFVREIFPRIRRARPSVQLDIVGGDPTPSVRALESDSVHVIGRVPDVRPWLERAALMVVPLRIGGGTRLKIVESLAMATPVVSTTIGAEGLGLMDGVHLSLADTPEAFAANTLAQLADPSAAAELGRRGHDFVYDRYRWSVLAEELLDYWERIAFSGKLSPSR